MAKYYLLPYWQAERIYIHRTPTAADRYPNSVYGIDKKVWNALRLENKRPIADGFGNFRLNDYCIPKWALTKRGE